MLLRLLPILVPLLSGIGACSRTASVRPASSQAAGIEIGEAAPPEGATSLGELEAVHGQGCGLFGTDGTLEGATAALREAAARRGANFVQIVETVEPHSTRQCFDHEFRIRAIAYRVGSQPAVPCNPSCSQGYACRAGVCEPLCNPPCASDQVCRLDRVCASKPDEPPAP